MKHIAEQLEFSFLKDVSVKPALTVDSFLHLCDELIPDMKSIYDYDIGDPTTVFLERGIPPGILKEEKLND